MTLGNVFSQVSIYASLHVYNKVSFTAGNGNHWQKARPMVYEDFEYWQSSASHDRPNNLGLSVGIKFKRHSIESGLHFDNVSSNHYYIVVAYNPFYNASSKQKLPGSTRAFQYRFFVNYNFYLVNRDKKTTFFITPTYGLCYRAGPKGIGNVGTLGFSGLLGNGDIYYESESAGFTGEAKYASNWGFGFGSDIYFRGFYIFTPSIFFAYSKAFLNFDLQTMTIYKSTGKTEYVFESYDRCTGLYFGFTRKFTLYPWKPIKKIRDWK